MPHARVSNGFVRTLLVVLAAIGLTGCDIFVNTMEGGKAKAADLWTRTYTVSEGAQIEVANTNGRIEVEGTDGTAVDVKAEILVRAGTDEAAKELLKQVEIREESSAGLVRLETRYPKGLGRSHVEVKYLLRVPRSAVVTLESTNGKIVVTNVDGFVKAETTNGGIVGVGLTGGVTASSTNGGIDMSVREVSDKGVTLETTNGGIEFTMPSSAKGTLSARVVNGGIKVSSDLKVEKTESSRRRLDGTINGGGPAIRLETVNGGISVTGQ